MSFALAFEDHIRHTEGWDAESVPPSTPTSGTLENLYDPRLGVGARFSGGTNADFSPYWSDPRPVQIISILDVRTDATTLPFGVWVRDSDAVLHDLTPGFFLATYPTSDFVRHHHLILPAELQAVAIFFSFQYSVSGSFVSIGRVWAGPLWTAPRGIRSRWTHSVIDPGEMGVSRGGQGYPRHRQRRRRLDAELSLLTFEQAFGNEAGTVLDLQQVGFRVGTTEPVICLPDTSSAQAIHRLGIYGHLTDALAIRHVEGEHFDAAMRVNELL